MANYPILVFPDRDNNVQRERRSPRPIPHAVGPSASRQEERLGPKFQVLQDTFSARRARLASSADAIDPEEVLVLETVGSVNDFINAVKRVEGLDWLGDFDTEECDQDDDFHMCVGQNYVEGQLTDGKLYLISSNSQALSQLLRLWTLYQRGEQFDYGLSKFRNVFSLLRTIRPWGIDDRIPPEVIRSFDAILQENHGRDVKVEIELWHRSSPAIREQKIRECHDLILKNGGSILAHCDIPEIEYTAFLASLPCELIRDVVTRTDYRLFSFDGIMFAKPQGQSIFRSEPLPPESLLTFHGKEEEAPVGDPIVGIFDGVPLSNHCVLKDRIIFDDPDGFEADYAVEGRVHGTAMCSCIIKGDIGDNLPYIGSPLYLRPIFTLTEFNGKYYEQMPNVLPADFIHRAVKRMFEGDNGGDPVAPSVRIINFSVGIEDYHFAGKMSPLARMLDWLSNKYHVLFIVSAGNSEDSVPTDLNSSQLSALSQDEIARLFFLNSLTNIKEHSLLSPAESINSISVGALHDDSAGAFIPANSINPYNSIVPSTYTSFGNGLNRSIKPEIVEKGGRLIYRDMPYNGFLIKNHNIMRAPGIIVAHPDTTLRNNARRQGTSEAAALTTRKAYYCYKAIQQLESRYHDIMDYSTEIIKAMLVHGCSWGQIENNIDSLLPTALNKAQRKKIKRKMIGYGKSEIQVSTYCEDNYATVLGYGEIGEDEGHEYRFPLPISLASKACKRKLTITLAWFSDINCKSARYKGRKIWFKPTNNEIADDRLDNNSLDCVRGTVQHEVFEGKSAIPFTDDDGFVNIQVFCTKDAISNPSIKSKYALIVTIDTAPGDSIPVYTEVASKINIQVQVPNTI